jgi:hypothetical protein
MKLEELLAPDPRYGRTDAPNRILMASSLSFLLPMMAALKADAVYTAAVCGNLVVTSFLYHMTKDVTYFWIDQVAVFLYVVAFVYEVLFHKKKLYQVLVAIVTVYVTVIYHYGYLNECYIWDSDCSLSSAHHAGMHVIASLAGAITLLGVVKNE